MLVGTVVGVLIIPGLCYLFGQLDGGRKLLRDETNEPLSEVFEHQAQEALDGHGDGLQHPPGAAVPYPLPPSGPIPSPRPDRSSKKPRPIIG